MFISKLTGPQKVAKIYSIIALAPRQIREELSKAKIVYRGIVDITGRYGDLLVRLPGNRVVNIVWSRNHAEIREIERAFVKSLISLYDSVVQQVGAKMPADFFNRFYIINQKVTLKSKFKGLKPL